MILPDPDYRELQRAARARHMSIAEWVRQAIHSAQRQQPSGEFGRKLEIIRAATRNEFPVAEIDTMLAEIERGYASGQPQ